MLFFASLLVFTSFDSCKVNSYSVQELQSRYERKMNRRGSERYTDRITGRKIGIKKRELFEKIKIYFSESEIYHELPAICSAIHFTIIYQKAYKKSNVKASST
jgi:hypothetical protein